MHSHTDRDSAALSDDHNAQREWGRAWCWQILTRRAPSEGLGRFKSRFSFAYVLLQSLLAHRRQYPLCICGDPVVDTSHLVEKPRTSAGKYIICSLLHSLLDPSTRKLSLEAKDLVFQLTDGSSLLVSEAFCRLLHSTDHGGRSADQDLHVRCWRR